MEEKLSLVALYQKKFEDGLALGLSLPSTVNQHSDYYVLQAAHLMMEVYGETGRKDRVGEVNRYPGSVPELRWIS